MKTDPRTLARSSTYSGRGTRITGLVVLCTLAFVLCPSLDAGRVKVWHHHRPADHESAQRKGVVQSDSGSLRLSRRLSTLAKLDCNHVWSVVETPSGTLYAATGEEGKLFRVAGGKTTLAWSADTSQVR